MSIIIFLIILSLLVFVHELGHFLIAKKSGIRVDEFAVGFPPKIFAFTRKGTRYALNLIPFGGYVKIYGETPDEESSKPEAADSFVNKSKLTQAAVLIGGILFNILFAWLLFTISVMSGFPSVVTEDSRHRIEDVNVVITNVLEESPAATAGLQSGDKLIQLQNQDTIVGGELAITDVQAFISANNTDEVVMTVMRGEDVESFTVTAEEGILEGKPAIGISMDMIGVLKLPIHKAIIEGFYMTGEMVRGVTIGLLSFFGDVFTAQADMSSVAGPVGIVSLVDDASQFGLIYLLGFTAFISINLAILNLLPFPALDGGRLLFVLIEAITRKPIKPEIANTLNLVGFIILIGLMLLVTVNDVIKLF